MMNRRFSHWLALLTMLILAGPIFATAQDVTLDNVVAPDRNRPDEAFAERYSLNQAAHFLDSASLGWQKSQGCMTCHTNFAYLFARPAISDDAPAHTEVRRFAESMVQERWQERGPRSDAEVVAAAAALAFNDDATSGQLAEATQDALDAMWSVQREDGGWSWLKCGWPPMESDDHYGVTLAAIAVGVAPEDYRQTEPARDGLSKIRQYLDNHPPTTLHHQGMLVWASSYLEGLITTDQQQETVEQILNLQKEDGGWGLATFGDWDRADGKPQDLETSDGYGTGFAIYVLRRSGMAADTPSIQKGIEWLKTHQRESGRWFTRSLNSDNRHYLTHAGTAWAVMALAECEE